MLAIPQICLIVLTAVIDAKNIHGVACHLKRDRHAPSVSYSSQTWPYIVVARSSMREGREAETMFHDGGSISLANLRRGLLANITMQLHKLRFRPRREDDAMRHALADFQLALGFGLQSGQYLFRGAAYRRVCLQLVIGGRNFRAKPSFKGLVACRARNPSRITSLSLAYSPDETLVLTICAISFGNVTLNCCVLRMGISLT